MEVEIKGTLVEVGNLDSGYRGVRIKKNEYSEIVEINGLTEKECREIAQRIGEIITVRIS